MQPKRNKYSADDFSGTVFRLLLLLLYLLKGVKRIISAIMRHYRKITKKSCFTPKWDFYRIKELKN